jgi:hypothetical protein
MRHNGLPAASWVLLADLDPRVANAALDALRVAGVAAYTNPHPGIQRPYLDVLPNTQPTDQLYVDSSARERAKAVLAGLDDAPPRDQEPTGAEPDDVDAEFARIVADFGPASEEATSRTSWPTATTSSDLTGWEIVGAARHEGPEEPAPSASLEEEHFVPPVPPPVPKGDVLSRFCWLGLLGAPVVGLVSVMAGWTLEAWQALVLVGAFVGGFATLVIRMGDDDVDDDPQSGAVV